MAHKSGRQRREETETTASPDDDGEGVNPEARRLLLEVVDNQLRANDPRETRATYDRLMGEGHSPDEAKRLIALVPVSYTHLTLPTKRIV